MNEFAASGDAALRLALRGLHRDIAPGHDLWPGIAARLQPQLLTQQLAQPLAQVSRPASSLRTWPWALAASLLLALGLAGQGGPQQVRPVVLAPQRIGTIAVPAPQTQALTQHYHAALQELEPRAAPVSWQPGLQALDQGAEQVRAALRKNPDSPLLLGQLRQIYARKLALSRRALFA